MIICPKCNEECTPGDRFCESCAHPLPVPEGSGPINAVESCVCGSKEWDEDGLCISCGRPKNGARASSYARATGPGLVASTDIGKRHHRNEDAFAISGSPEGGHGSILFVCDGVSSSQNPQQASAAAAKAGCDWAQANLTQGKSSSESMRQAIIKAHDAVCAVPFNRQAELEPPSCTIVGAYIESTGNGQYKVTVAWLGDSRAFWLSQNGVKQLTVDHSWVEEIVASGQMTQEAAEKDRRAHAITKFLGTTDFSVPTPCMEPSVKEFTLPPNGRILLCSDGLWNYANQASDIVNAANGAMWKENLSEACERLVAFANRSGGQDNVTVAIAKLN